MDPIKAEGWIIELEKAFAACQVPEDRKVDLAIYLMKQDAYNWWMLNSEEFVRPILWNTFKDAFFLKYIPSTVRE